MDARFPTHYLNDRRVMRLSPVALRQLVLGTAWSVTNRTDGAIQTAELGLIPFASVTEADELVSGGLWAASEDGWLIVDFAATQTSKAQLDGLDQRRRLDADRQARLRSRAKSVDSSRDMSRDDKGKESARQGEARTTISGNANFWPTATIPES